MHAHIFCFSHDFPLLDQVYWRQHTELPIFKQNKLVESPLQVNITPKKVGLNFLISPCQIYISRHCWPEIMAPIVISTAGLLE